MPRATKDSRILNCKIERSISEQLDALVNETGLSKTATVERALLRYLEYYKKTGRV